MAAYLPTEGEYLILDLVLRGVTTNRGLNLQIGLFTNATVNKSTTYATITEPTGSGYARKSLTDTSWVLSSSNPTIATYPIQTFTATGTWVGNVYGYFIATTGSTPKLLTVETITGGPFSFLNGKSYSVTPIIKQG